MRYSQAIRERLGEKLVFSSSQKRTFVDAEEKETILREMVHQVDEILHRQFRPEFLNRIDETIIFHGLSKEDLAKIVDIQVALLTKRLAEKKFSISLTDRAKNYLIEVGYEPSFGARPLKRAIQRYIQDQLALHILEGKFIEGDRIVVDADAETHTLLFSKE
jgi:ATP-dependent Clp protease ATP-binding subunit ClpB